ACSRWCRSAAACSSTSSAPTWNGIGSSSKSWVSAINTAGVALGAPEEHRGASRISLCSSAVPTILVECLERCGPARADAIDRSVRPLFPEGFKNEVQVFVYVLSADQENDADVLGLTAASAALTMSKVPWNGPIAAVRVGRVEGAWILNPTFQQLEFSDVDMVMSGSKDSIVMVEGGALELTEAEIVKGLEVAHKGIRELLDAANELVADMRQPK